MILTLHVSALWSGLPGVMTKLHLQISEHLILNDYFLSKWVLKSQQLRVWLKYSLIYNV